MIKRTYRITERIMADNTYQFVPEACDNKRSSDSLWDRILQKLNPDIWYSVADTYHELNDCGYKTFEMAMDRLLHVSREKPQEVKILRVVNHDVKL